MHLDALLWMFLPMIVAAGSALLAFFIMQARMEVAVAKERETLAAAQATIQAQKVTMEERVKATEEATRRTTMDQLMQDFRMEERSYVRESSSEDASKRTMVMQERMFFRNIPLSDWMEHEMVVEDNRSGAPLGIPAARNRSGVDAGVGDPRLPQGRAARAQALPQGFPQTHHEQHPFPVPDMFSAQMPTRPTQTRESLPVSKAPNMPEVSNESLAALNRALTAAGRPVNAPGLVMSSLVVSEAALAAMDSSAGFREPENRSNGSRFAPEPKPEKALAVRDNRVLAAAFGAQ